MPCRLCLRRSLLGGFVLLLQVVHYRVALLIAGFALSFLGLVLLLVVFFLVLLEDQPLRLVLGLGIFLLVVLAAMVWLVISQSRNIGVLFVDALRRNPANKLE